MEGKRRKIGGCLGGISALLYCKIGAFVHTALRRVEKGRKLYLELLKEDNKSGKKRGVEILRGAERLARTLTDLLDSASILLVYRPPTSLIREVGGSPYAFFRTWNYLERKGVMRRIGVKGLQDKCLNEIENFIALAEPGGGVDSEILLNELNRTLRESGRTLSDQDEALEILKTLRDCMKEPKKLKQASRSTIPIPRKAVGGLLENVLDVIAMKCNEIGVFDQVAEDLMKKIFDRDGSSGNIYCSEFGEPRHLREDIAGTLDELRTKLEKLLNPRKNGGRRDQRRL